MPKIVDHDQRRREIAAVVSDLAARKGLCEVSFREVASAAGVSVSLVQHYFGHKANLLRATLEFQSEEMNTHIAGQLAELGTEPDPGDLLRAVARAFLPLDETSRRSMLVYHAFAAAALTDTGLRGNEMFTNGRGLIDFFAGQLLALRGEDSSGASDAAMLDANGLLSMLLGVSIAVLLDQTTPEEAIAIVDQHVDRLAT